MNPNVTFINLRGLPLVTKRFSFWDNEFDKFLTLGNKNAWSTHAEFKRDYIRHTGNINLSAYEALMPDWTRE